MHALHSPFFCFFFRKKRERRSIRAGRALESRNNVRSSEILRKFLVERLFQGEKSPSHQSFLIEKKGRWSSQQRWILIKGLFDCYGEMNRSNVLISWIIRGENGTISSFSLSFSRPIHLWWVSEAVFSLDRILIAIRRARFDIRWRGLSIEAATFHWIGSMLIVKSITIFLWTLLISGRGRERRVLLSSILFPSLPSLSFSFLQHWPRKIKLRMLVTGVRRRNAWTIRDRTQNSTRYSPVRWKSWQRVVIPIPFRPYHPLFQFLSFRNATQMRTMLDNGRKEIEK